jgi:NADH dehydrogenase
VLFGREDILVNNIAWLMRKFPVFPIFGSGEYRLQPIYVGDLARVAVAEGKRLESKIVDAGGPEEYTYAQMVRMIAASIKPGIKFIHLPASLGVALGRLIGLFVRDVILTQDEARGLMENRLTSSQPPLGTTQFSQWIADHKDLLGRQYQSELERHFRWKLAQTDES